MAESNTGSILKEKIVTLLGSDIAPNKVIWELFPNYCKLKLSHLKLISTGLSTNESGKEIKVTLFLINQLPIEQITIIIDVLEVIYKSTSDNWSQFEYSYIPISSINDNYNLVKYTFTSKNDTVENLAEKKRSQFFIFIRNVL